MKIPKQIADAEAVAANRFAEYGKALQSAGHSSLAKLFADEALHCERFAPGTVSGLPIPFLGVQACFSILLCIYQQEIIPLVLREIEAACDDERAQLMEILACNERQLDWVEAQVYTIQELGEVHYLQSLGV